MYLGIYEVYILTKIIEYIICGTYIIICRVHSELIHVPH